MGRPSQSGQFCSRMERGRVVWPVGLESIQEDCLLNDPAISSDISDDEARIELIEQAEFDRLEAALDRSFGKAKLETAAEEEERETDQFFAEPRQALGVESATGFLGETQELLGISLKVQSKEDADKENYERTIINAPPNSTKKGAGSKAKAKRSFTIEEGRQEIEKRLNEMRRTEIDQVSSF